MTRSHLKNSPLGKHSPGAPEPRHFRLEIPQVLLHPRSLLSHTSEALASVRNFQMASELIVIVASLLCCSSAWGIGEVLFVRHGYTAGANTGMSYVDAFQGFGEVVWDEDDGDTAGEVGKGDTLYICGGPYDDGLSILESGTSDHYITLSGNCSAVDGNYADGVIGRISLANIGQNSVFGHMLGIINDEFLIIEHLSFHDSFGVAEGYRVREKERWPVRKATSTHPTILTDLNQFNVENCTAANIPVDCCTGLDTGTCAEAWRWAGSLVGGVIFNRTQSTKGVITANTYNTITSDIAWTIGDEYSILDDTGWILLSGTSNNIIIRNNTFDLEDGDGFAIYGELDDNDVVHDITIDSNSFSGNGDFPVYFFHQYAATTAGTFYNLTVTHNTGTDLFGFLKSRILRHNMPKLDPDSDGRDNDDRAPYGFDIGYNTIEISEGPQIGSNFVSFGSGMHEVAGPGFNHIHHNTITTVGVQDDYTNIVQTFWHKDLVVEWNVIEGPTMTGHCDGNAIIIDYAITDPLYNSDGIIIRNNIIHNATDENSGSVCTGKGVGIWRGSNTQIYNNLFYDNDIGIKVASEGTNVNDNTLIYNNTIVNSSLQGIFIDDYTADPTNVVIKNNIVFGYGDTRTGIRDDTDAAVIDYNLVDDDNSTSHCSAPAGCGPNSITDQDPAFKNLIDYELPVHLSCDERRHRRGAALL